MGAAGTPLGNMVIRLGLDDTDFGKGVANSKKQIRYLAKEMQANMKIADLAGNNLGKLGTKYESLTSIIAAQEKQVTSLKKAYDESFVDGKATESTKRLAAELQGANGKLAAYKKQLITTAGAYAEMKVKTTGATGAIYNSSKKLISAGQVITNTGEKISKTGSALTAGLTLPVAAGFAFASKSAIDFNSQLATVRALLNDGSVPAKQLNTQIQKLGDSSKNWSKQYGVSTTAINSGMEEIIKKGYSYEQTMGAMPNILDASKASGEDFNTVMGATTSILEQYGLKVTSTNGTLKNTQRVTDSLTFVANKTAAGFSDMGLAMEYVGPVAHSAGISLEETSAAVGLLSNNGIEGEKAGTSLRGALTRLLKPSKENIAGFEKLGISVDDFKNGTMTLPDMLDKIKANTQGWTKAQKASAIAMAFGTQAQTGMNILVGQGGDALRKLTKETEGATGYTKQLADQLNNTDKNKVERFKQSLNVLSITIGEKLLPTITPWLEKGTQLINQFSELDNATQQNIIKWLALGAAAGPALKVFGTATEMFGKTTSGVGRLGKAFVDLSANMAKKNAIKETTEALAEGAVESENFAGTLEFGAGSILKFGGAAEEASGASGIGAMAASLGPLGPAILGVVGVGGALAVGYGAWKLFGEEAWNSSQRVKRWGNNVNQTTDETLGKVRDNTNQATGKFSLMAQGFNQESKGMITNFQQIGSAIQTDLTNQINTLHESVKKLPEEVRSAGDQIVKKGIADRKEALSVVKANNAEMLKIKKQYSDDEGNVTAQGSKMIQDLMRQNANEYLKITIKDADDRKKVANALTGNVEQATKQQATAWLQSLGKQREKTREEYTAKLSDYKKYLKEQGILNTDEGKQLVKVFEQARDQSTDAFDTQMATIIKKYPELAKVVSLTTGDLVSNMANSQDIVADANNQILANAENLGNKLSENAKRNAKQIAWTADEGTKAGKTWNALKLFDKKGNMKTNATEIVTEAAKDSKKWNDLKLVLHDAHLDSNAKLMIGEAAIASGQWDKMSWKDQKAILKDEFSQTMYKTLKSSGDWNNMSLEQKKALLYSNTPEKMAETMIDLGMWQRFQPQIKQLKAKNRGFLEVLSQSQEKLANWQSVPDDVKKILGNNYDFLQKIYSSDQSYSRWVNLPNDQKKLLADNTDFMQKLLSSDTMWNEWNSIPDAQKKILADNQDLLNKVFGSQQMYSAWTQLPDNLKKMLGDNKDIINKLNSGEIKLNQYDANNPQLKQLLGDSYNVQLASSQGQNALNLYKANNPSRKILRGDSSSTQNAARQGGNSLNIYSANNPNNKYLRGDSSSVNSASASGNRSLNSFSGNNPGPKHLQASDETGGPVSRAMSSISSFASGPSTITKTLRVVADIGAGVAKILGLETGTNYHAGGPAIINDQQGPVYKELVIPNGGIPFVAEGRNVFLPDLAKGSKVIKASETKRLLPHYKEGVGIHSNSSVVSSLVALTTTKSDSSQSSEVVNLLKELLGMLKNGKIKNMEVNQYLTTNKNPSERELMLEAERSLRDLARGYV